MTTDEEHDLKMNFLRQLQNSAAVANPNRKDRRGKRGGRMAGYRAMRAEECLALGCHPTQVQERRDLTKKLGLTAIETRDDGSCFTTDEKQRDLLFGVLVPGGENKTGILGG